MASVRSCLLVAASLALGCSASDFTVASGDVDAVVDTSAADGAEPGDTTVDDTTVGEDGFLTDGATADTFVADTSIADTPGVDGAKPDTAVTDTAKADTAKADTAKADTFVADTAKADTSVVFDAIEEEVLLIDKCTTTICIGTMKCCPSTGTCYDPKCLSCCMP